MAKFEHKLGDIVKIGPNTGLRFQEGLVCGRTEYIDGSVGYVVSAASFTTERPVVRHFLNSWELHAKDES